MAYKNYYEILEVKDNCTIHDIKQSYHKLALKHHPDRNNNTNGDEFKTINTAYKNLIDPEKRHVYDMTLKLRNNIFFKDQSSSSCHDNNDMCDNINTYMKNFNFNDIHIFGVDASTFIHKTRDFINITKNIIHTYNKKRYNSEVESQKRADNSMNNKETANKTDTMETNSTCTNDDTHSDTYSEKYYDTSTDIRTPDIYHDVFINLNEIYQNKIKKVNVKVKRYNIDTNIYEYVRIKLLIEPSEKINIFENEADDMEGYTMRGDIIIHIIPIDYNSILYLEKNDLYIEKNISIYELCYGVAFHLDFLDNKKYTICINNEINIDKLYIIEGMGLKNFTDDSTDRLLIKFKLKIKNIDIDTKKNIKNTFPPLHRDREDNDNTSNIIIL